MDPTVELRPAYQWICPDCGHLNFEAVRSGTMTEKQKAELAAAGVENVDELIPVEYPLVVTCKECFTAYSATTQDIKLPDDFIME